MTSVTAAPAPSEEIQSRWGPTYVQILREWLESGETVWLSLAGDSMAPILPSGTRVLLGPVDVARVGPGDIVVYDAHASVVCHRVLRRGALGEVVQAKGDAWRATATWVPTSQIFGEVVAVKRRDVRLDFATPRRRLAGKLIAACSRALERIVPPLRRVRWLIGW